MCSMIQELPWRFKLRNNMYTWLIIVIDGGEGKSGTTLAIKIRTTDLLDSHKL